jgi:ABC-type phosphate transport system substrate-binding protein
MASGTPRWFVKLALFTAAVTVMAVPGLLPGSPVGAAQGTPANKARVCDAVIPAKGTPPASCGPVYASDTVQLTYHGPIGSTIILYFNGAEVTTYTTAANPDVRTFDVNMDFTPPTGPGDYSCQINAFPAATPPTTKPVSLHCVGTGRVGFNLISVGSDTLYCLDNAIVPVYNSKIARSTGNVVSNVAPIGGVNLGCGNTPLNTTVSADTVHPAINFANPPSPPDPYAPPGNANVCSAPLSGVAMPWEYPDGSGLGIVCYTDDTGASPDTLAGDISFTRSSSGPSSTNPTSLQFFADALDAVTWSSNYANAPSSLTPAQITDILNCTDTEWGQVNGDSSDTTPINVWIPQSYSGTMKFFDQLFNGGVYPGGSPCIPASQEIEENDGAGVTGANSNDAFYPYSFAQFTAQTNGTETNLTNGFTLGGVSGVAPTTTTIKEPAALTNESGGDACSAPTPGSFCATRYVYHVVSTELPSDVYGAAIGFMGVPGNGSGTAASTSICSNAYASTISKYGFKPLTKAATVAGGTGKSYCRMFVP